MKKEAKSLTNRQVVTQHNGIISGKYELTEAEQKIILLAIAQVDSKNDDEFITFKATIPELEQKLNTTLHQGQLKETCRKLMQRVVYIENEQGDWKMFNWISRAEYLNGANTIEFKISDEMKPYLLKLKGSFTKLQIENAIKFNGKYTTRFYQFLMKLQNTAERKERYELAELYKMLMLPKSMQTFGNFRMYVLDPSIKEINEKTDIKASYEIGRTGRKYTSITLSYAPKKTEQTLKARKNATEKYTNKQLKKFQNVEFARNELFGFKFYICKNFTIAPEINIKRGDGKFCAWVGDGGFFYNSISEFEADIKLAKENQHKKQEAKYRPEVKEFFEN